VWVFLTQLKEAMRTDRPMIFYYWEPEWPFAVYDLSEIELPPYEDSKWTYVEKRMDESSITCGWKPAQVYVGYGTKLQKKSPKTYRFFKQWYIPIDEVSFLIAELEDIPGNPKKDVEEVVEEWVRDHPAIVNDWIKGI